MMKRYLFLIAALLLPMVGFAQGTTSGSIQGTITSADGEPLPGANIVAIHQPTGTRYGASSRPNGRYTISNVRVGGPYEVQVTFVGFNAQVKEVADVELGETVQLDFTLEEGELELGEISVTAQADPVFNAGRTGASTNISSQDINNTPTISRSLTDFTRLTPQATGGGSFGGANDRYNNLLVDGATLNDVFGLGEGTPGSQAGVGSPISVDAIAEFNVDIAPFDVTNNGFTGGQINAVTKSGTNTFTGSAYYQMRNESFVGQFQHYDARPDLGDNIFERVHSNDYPEFSEHYVGLNLGGPIIEDKLFFFVNGEFRRESNPLTTGVAGSGAANEFPLGADTFNQISSIAQNQYDYDPGGYGLFTPNEDNNKLLAKIDWNINDDHKLTFRYNHVDALSEQGVDRYTDNYSFNNSQYNFESIQNSFVAELNSSFGNDVSNTFRAVYTRLRDSRNVVGEEFPYVNVSLEASPSNFVGINLGVDNYSQANRLDQDLIEITNNLTYFRGDHEFTIGTSNQLFSFENLFVRNAFGSYEFRSMEDWENGDPYSYEHSFLREGGNEAASFTGIQLGLYVQDEWSATDYLQLTFGLRADMPLLPDEPSYNPQVDETFPGYSTSRTASGNILWSPRFGFNLDASQGERTTQIRGGVGIFSGNPPFVWISNQYGNTGMDYGRIDLSGGDLPIDFQPDPDQQPSPLTRPDLDAINTTEVNLTSEDFKYPQSLKFNLAVDQQLPFGVVATVEGIYSNMLNEVTFRNLNLQQVGSSAHGRPFYGDILDLGFGNASGEPARVNGQDFTDVILLDNTNKGHQYSLTGELEKQFENGLNANISYTYNRTETVNNGTSSQAVSNWEFNETFDINNAELGPADFERRHRLLGQFSYRMDYADRFATTFSLIYEGRSGTPFSWIYSGDANGDGQFANDLIYVPENESEVEMLTGNWEEYNNWIESTESMNQYRGSYVERGSAREPWTHYVDLRVNQEIETIAGQRLELTASVFNVLNLLNDEWGTRQYVSTGYNNYQAVTIHEYNDQDIPVISFDADNVSEDNLYSVSDLGSRWQLQLGVRYHF